MAESRQPAGRLVCQLGVWGCPPLVCLLGVWGCPHPPPAHTLTTWALMWAGGCQGALLPLPLPRPLCLACV